MPGYGTKVVLNAELQALWKSSDLIEVFETVSDAVFEGRVKEGSQCQE